MTVLIHGGRDRPLAHRLVRDGLAAAAPCATLPADLRDRPALRALAYAPCVPRGAALTGAAAMWVIGFGGAAPAGVTVAVRRGAHPDPLPCDGEHPWVFVTDSHGLANAAPVGGVLVVPPASAVAAMLASSPWPTGITALAWACAEGLAGVTEVRAAVMRQAAGRPRAAALAAIDLWASAQQPSAAGVDA